MMSETKIETAKSKLIVHQLPTDILDTIKMAIEKSKDKLNKTPKIFVFGKESRAVSTRKNSRKRFLSLMTVFKKSLVPF